MVKKELGKVVELFISKSGYDTRIKKDILELDLYGVIEDKFYNKDTKRSVLLTSEDSYNLIKNNNIKVDHGILGENLLLSFNPYSLNIGDQLKIGDTILEITQRCTICNHLASIDKSLPSLLENDRGVFSKVIKNGKVKINDTIYLIG